MSESTPFKINSNSENSQGTSESNTSDSKSTQETSIQQQPVTVSFNIENVNSQVENGKDDNTPTSTHTPLWAPYPNANVQKDGNGGHTPPWNPYPNNTPPKSTSLPNSEVYSATQTENEYTELARKLIKTYFQTVDYPFIRHHIDSYDQFLTQDLPAMIKANNPLILLRDLINRETNQYMHRVEIYVGGQDGSAIEIGTPTVSLQNSKEVRVLFPNEARLRNLTYASIVYADVLVKLIVTLPGQAPSAPITREFKRMPLFKLPILLQSRFCLLHNKPKSFLKEAGECVQDPGGYFIVGGSEKVLVTRQEQAFNTMYIKKRPADPKVATYGTMTCLSPSTRLLRVIGFNWIRATDSLVVTLPFVRKAVPVFVLFRALGYQSDGEILRLLFPDLDGNEAQQMIPHLLPSIAEAHPFMDTYSAIQFIKPMTKGFTENHVWDILYNQVFIHIPEKYGSSRAHFLADCVRKFLRVHLGIDPDTDRDDTQNQRCLPTGTLLRMLFGNVYTTWLKAVKISIDKEYNYNPDYRGEKSIDMFNEGNFQKIFNLDMMTEGIMRGFKGKWITGGAKADQKEGALQALSRLSYMDFMSHLRRVNLNFDTGDKNPRPRKLHTSQYGFFCTNETPSGASIGITKNLTLLTLISLATNPEPIIQWLINRSWVIPCTEMRPDLQLVGVPLFINNGIVGYTMNPFELTKVLKYLKWTGCLPATTSIGFNIKHRRIFLFVDEGRPCRPLIHLGEKGKFPKDELSQMKDWHTCVFGTWAATKGRGISTTGFLDPYADQPGPISIQKYIDLLEPHIGMIEYVDPYEQNLTSLVSFPEEITESNATTVTHCEIHPSTIVSIVNGMVPFANFNQSPRNQLSCSQSKQAISLYATNFQNRFDNNANIACYNQAPLVRTYQYDLLGEGKMPYGHNVIMAIMCYKGYNQDDGIVFNYDSFKRGMFRNINTRSYTIYEEVDLESNTKSIVANPMRVSNWLDIRPGNDYTKLDENGIIRVGEFVNEHTVLVGKYTRELSREERDPAGMRIRAVTGPVESVTEKIIDTSVTAQVWTSGRVESVSVTYNNNNQRMIKIRVTEDRVPELGDKFSTRHGQKGVIGMLLRAHDMPRTKEGLVPDMIVNPHCIPSRMTIAQLLEMLFGEVCYNNTMIGDASLFMNVYRAVEVMGTILEHQFGLERTGNHILYDGISGVQIATNIFMGPVYAMRLKHMVEDKLNVRAEGRKEQRTHQPTGGRGAQGGLRIGEMERDALVAHGTARFMRESIMERADKTVLRVCNGCGTVPIYNEKQNLFVCSLCDGPVQYVGSSIKNLEILPSVEKSLATSSLVEMPYATKLLAEEMAIYLNIGMRFLTSKGLTKLQEPAEMETLDDIEVQNALQRALPPVEFPAGRVPEMLEPSQEETRAATQITEEDFAALGVISQEQQERKQEEEEEKKRQAKFGAALDVQVTTQQPPFTQAPKMQKKQTGWWQNDENNANTQQQLQPQMQPQTTIDTSIATSYPTSYTPPGSPTQQQQGMGATPFRGGAYMMPPMMQPMMGGMMATMPPMMAAMPPMMATMPPPLPPPQQPVILNTNASGSPPIIVIPSNAQELARDGYDEDAVQAGRGQPVMGGANPRRHTTPRARPMSPRKGHDPAFGGGPVAPSTRITIRKLS